MNTKTFQRLRVRRREIEDLLTAGDKTPGLVYELKWINAEIKRDPPTVEQVYATLGS